MFNQIARVTRKLASRTQEIIFSPGPRTCQKSPFAPPERVKRFRRREIGARGMGKLTPLKKALVSRLPTGMGWSLPSESSPEYGNVRRLLSSCFFKDYEGLFTTEAWNAPKVFLAFRRKKRYKFILGITNISRYFNRENNPCRASL